jgi:mttA/Hcf106 family
MTMQPLFGTGFVELLTPAHILLVLVVGLLLFGKRLPEVGRHMGKRSVEMKWVPIVALIASCFIFFCTVMVVLVLSAKRN